MVTCLAPTPQRWAAPALQVDLYRANAVRVLCQIVDTQLLGQIERYLKQAVVDKSPVVASAVLASAQHLMEGGSAEIIKRWVNEVQEAVQSKHPMVQVSGRGGQQVPCRQPLSLERKGEQGGGNSVLVGPDLGSLGSSSRCIVRTTAGRPITRRLAAALFCPATVPCSGAAAQCTCH